MVLGLLWAYGNGSPGRADDLTALAPRPSPYQRVDYITWLNDRAQPPGDNDATTKYFSAFSYLKPIGDPTALERATAGPWNDLPVVDAWLSANRRALKMFRQASEGDASILGIRAGSGGPAGSSWSRALLFVTVPGLAAFEVSAQGKLADGWRRWEQGDQTVLVDNALVNLSAAHHLQAERPMEARFSVLAIAEQSYTALRRALALSTDRDQLAQSLAGRLTQWDPPLSALTVVYHFQKLIVWDTLQRMYRPGSLNLVAPVQAVYEHLGRLTGGVAPQWDQVREAVAAAGFESSLQETDRFFEGLLAWNKQPYHAASRRVEEIVEMGRRLRNPLLRVLVVKLTQPRKTLARVEALQRGTHLLARILSYHGQRGRYPDSLDALGATPIIKALRVDPYSGRDFIYAQTRDNFVLYSVGSDRKDDAGRPCLPHREAGDLVIWPVRSK